MSDNRVCVGCGRVFIPNTPKKRYCTRKCNMKQLESKRLASYREYNAKYGVGKGGSNKKGTEGYTYSTGTGIYRKIKLDSMTVYHCERCTKDLTEFITNGGRNSMWTVHHKDGDRTHNNLENLELLCKRCHQIEHNCYDNLTQ